MKKWLYYLFGIFNYLVALGVFIYLIGFLANFLVPKSVDSGSPGPFLFSLLINAGLITIFALQHSIMARQKFKNWWTGFIPKPVERSVYVLFSSLGLALTMVFWQPIPETVWFFDSQPVSIILWTLYGFGWIFLFISTRLINDRHLFGIQQVRQYLKDKKISEPKFQTPAFYRFTRHPMMLGFLISFWATPKMSVGHLIFSLVFTIYINIGMRLEEKDLIRYFGDRYRKYRRQVSMLIPGLKNNFSENNYISSEDSSPAES